MVASAKSYLLLSFAAAVCSLAVPTAPVVSHQNGEQNTLSIKFEAPCHRCLDDAESSVIFDLDIPSSKSVCGESHVRLNGQKLGLTWDGNAGTGVGSVKGQLVDGKGAANLSLNLQTYCIASPKGSVEDYAAQIMAVTFSPVGKALQPSEDETSGFALSFNPVGKPRVFRLVTSPISISDEDESFESWLDSSDAGQLPVQYDHHEEPMDVDALEEELKRLHLLRKEAERLDALIAEKDRKIRLHLMQDCGCLIARLRKCGTFKCFVKTSFKFVPDVFRLMKYRFGPLPPTLANFPCAGLANSTGTRTGGNSTAGHTNIFNSTGISKSNPVNVLTQTPPVPVISQKRKDTERLIKDVIIISFFIVFIVFLCKKHRNSLSCRRRRVDIAARREERRARCAYRAAAQRYRWRLWWNNLWHGGNNIPPPSGQLTPGQLEAHNMETNPHAEARRSQESENNMGAEIMGFRRALEYVGQLVNINGDDDPEHYEQPPQHTPARASVRNTARPPTVISSVAPLTTIGSARSSTVLSYDDSDDLGTIESIDLETATMISS